MSKYMSRNNEITNTQILMSYLGASSIVTLLNNPLTAYRQFYTSINFKSQNIQ